MIISIEGIDGAGKNTLVRVLTSRIDAAHNTHSDGSLLDPQLEELLAPQTVEQAQDYLTEQAYVLPLVEQPVVYGLRTHVHGFDTDPTVVRFIWGILTILSFGMGGILAYILCAFIFPDKPKAHI